MSEHDEQIDLVEIESIPEEIIRRAEAILGYTFRDKRLLRIALTHPSAVKEGMSIYGSYERMEFLGDSVLGMAVASEIYSRFSHLDEGGLTRIKVTLVSGTTLSAVAREEGIDKVIIFGASEAGTNGRGLTSALEDVYEALVAALYLDGGYNVARGWILKTLAPRISLDLAMKLENPKSSLQEYLQARGTMPSYEIVGEDGPPHDRVFTARVRSGEEVIGIGEGPTKKEAEASAAREALTQLKSVQIPM